MPTCIQRIREQAGNAGECSCAYVREDIGDFLASNVVRLRPYTGEAAGGEWVPRPNNGDIFHVCVRKAAGWGFFNQRRCYDLLYLPNNGNQNHLRGIWLSYVPENTISLRLEVNGEQRPELILTEYLDGCRIVVEKVGNSFLVMHINTGMPQNYPADGYEMAGSLFRDIQMVVSERHAGIEPERILSLKRDLAERLQQQAPDEQQMNALRVLIDRLPVFHAIEWLVFVKNPKQFLEENPIPPFHRIGGRPRAFSSGNEIVNHQDDITAAYLALGFWHGNNLCLSIRGLSFEQKMQLVVDHRIAFSTFHRRI
jgi:hypothetical protein